jgi:hypothetical protein
LRRLTPGTIVPGSTTAPDAFQPVQRMSRLCLIIAPAPAPTPMLS